MFGAHPTLFDRSTTYALAISALAAAWGGFLLTCRNVRTSALPPTALLGPSSVLIGSAALSILFNADAAWSNILPLVAQLLLLWLGWWLAAENGSLSLLGGGLLAGTVLIGLHALLQHWNLDPLPPLAYFDDRILSVFANPNHLGNFAACTLPLALAFFFYRSTASLSTYIPVGLSYAALLLSASRGAWVAGLGGCLVVGSGYIFAVRSQKAPWRPVALLFLGLLFVGLTALLSQRPAIHGPQGPISISERALSATNIIGSGTIEDSAPQGTTAQDPTIEDSTINHRYFLWQVTWQMVRDHPILGLGYGNYQIRFPHYRNAHKNSARFAHMTPSQRLEQTPYAHNEYLHLLAETGPLGLLAFLVLVGSGLWAGVRTAYNAGNLLIWGAIGFIIAMLIHSLVSYPLRLPFNGMSFWILLGIIYKKKIHLF